ncbi:MAG: hypothetical protein ACN0LA_03980 [Candidatus Longimicrobiales bacterium M2_2A_002]
MRRRSGLGARGPADGRAGLMMGLRLGVGGTLPAGFVLALGLAAAGPAPGVAQEATAALGVDTARVGDVVAVGIRITTGPGERVAWPDTLPLAGSGLENAARVTERVDTLGNGRLARTGVYSVTPWRTGALELPEVSIPVAADDDAARRVRVAGPTLTVASVLPADTAGLEPRPAKAVVGPSWAWGTILLIALLAAAAIGALLWWWRRRRVDEAAQVHRAPLVPPRERALAALQAAREAGLVERGEMKEFYTRLSDAVRDYVAALERTWGEDLTTTELLGRFRAQVGPSEAAALRAVLAPADQVKFARREPDPETAVAEWDEARSWVLGFDWPPRPVVTEEAA